MVTHNMHPAMRIILELEHTHDPPRAAEQASGKAITAEQCLMASLRSPKPHIKSEAVGLAGMQAWECNRAPRTHQNGNMQFFGILLSHSLVLASVSHLQHSYANSAYWLLTTVSALFRNDKRI